jgi:hypothetical protein
VEKSLLILLELGKTIGSSFLQAELQVLHVLQRRQAKNTTQTDLFRRPLILMVTELSLLTMVLVKLLSKLKMLEPQAS